MKEQVLRQSQVFWKGLEQADTAAMRSVCDDKCFFVHIGGNCNLDQEMDAFEKKVFQPTKIVLHSQEARDFGSAAIVISDPQVHPLRADGGKFQCVRFYFDG